MPGEFTPKGFADAVRLPGQVAESELDHGRDNARRDALQRAPCWAGEVDIAGHAAGLAVPFGHAEVGADRVLAVGASGSDVSVCFGDGVADAGL